MEKTTRPRFMDYLLYGAGLNGAEDIDTELKTSNGLDKLNLMMRFMLLIEGDPKKEFDKLKSWLVQQLKRGITKQEEADLLQGLHNYVISDPATKERSDAMDYLFNAKFLHP